MNPEEIFVSSAKEIMGMETGILVRGRSIFQIMRSEEHKMLYFLRIIRQGNSVRYLSDNWWQLFVSELSWLFHWLDSHRILFL